MKKGERGILFAIVGIVGAGMVYKSLQMGQEEKGDYDIPFFSTADKGLTDRAARLIKVHRCKECHSLWGTRESMQSVPAPPLDGLGMLRDESWFFEYLSASNPQEILPTRLKPRYRMPSFAELPEQDRRTLAAYLASLKVEDWYLEEVKKTEYEKLTGKKYQP